MSRTTASYDLPTPLSWSATAAYQEVANRIAAEGPIPFSQFMRIALYGASGYYTTARNKRKDYLTSPQTHPEFGACVMRCLKRMWSAMGRPDTFAVAELGAGDGALMRDIVSSATEGPSQEGCVYGAEFASALRYQAFDVSPTSADATSQVKHIDEVALQSDGVQCVVSNELLDALPVNRFVIRDGVVREVLVGMDGTGKLCEVEGAPIDSHLAQKLGHPITDYPDGYKGELAQGFPEWTQQVANLVKQGYVLTIDYGHPRKVLYDLERVGGTLRCYSDHVLGSDPFRSVGDHDISAHVDFTELDESLAARGFTARATLMTQADFLGLHGYDDAVLNARRVLATVQDETEANRLRQELSFLLALGDLRGLGAFMVAIHGVEVPMLFGEPC